MEVPFRKTNKNQEMNMNKGKIDGEHGLAEMDEKKPVLNSLLIGGILMTVLMILAAFLIPATKFIFK